MKCNKLVLSVFAVLMASVFAAAGQPSDKSAANPEKKQGYAAVNGLKMYFEIRGTGISILIVEQNAKAALAISDRGYILSEGQDRLSGVAAELLANPEVGALYLGAKSRLAS